MKETQQLRQGCFILVLGGLPSIASAVAAAWFYWNDETLKAIFWLLVAVLSKQWLNSMFDELAKRFHE